MSPLLHKNQLGAKVMQSQLAKKILVVVLTVVAISLLLARVNQPTPQGPVKLVVDQRQQLHVLADGVFYRLAADGRLLWQGRLDTALRAASDFGVLANGEVLVADADRKDFFRCNPDLKNCRSIYKAFGSKAGPLNNSLKLAVDEARDQLWLADTANHRVLLFNLSGDLRNSFSQRRFIYPNQIGFDTAGDLVIADTNHHRIAAFDPVGTLEAPRWQILVETHPDRRQSRRWPSAWAQVGEEWWVIAEDNGMVNGDVLRFAADGRPKGRAVLDAIDPLSLVSFGGEVLVADAAAAVVHRVALDGSKLGHFGDARFQAAMADIEKRSQRHKLYRRWLPAIIGLIALVAIFFLKRLGEPVSADDARWPQWQLDATQKMPAYLAPGEEVWLKADPVLVKQTKRFFSIIYSLLALMVLTRLWRAHELGWGLNALHQLAPHIVLIVSFWLETFAIQKGTLYEFGYDSTHALYRGRRGRVERVPLDKVRYSNRLIAIGRHLAALINAKGRQVFPAEPVRDGFLSRVPESNFSGPWAFAWFTLRVGSYSTLGMVALLTGLVLLVILL